MSIINVMTTAGAPTSCSAPPCAPLLIFDFDETLADKDSSEWVAAQLGAAPLFDTLMAQGMPWHHAMNVVLRTLHSQGTTITHIRQALCRLPLRLNTIAALKAAHALGCELRVLSDANTFFIETVLEHQGLASLFSHVHSNPAWIDAEGCLCYSSFHSDTAPPHNCPLCPANMCKGIVLDAIRKAAARDSSTSGQQIIYAGDGSGDLCPSLRLREGDYVLPREGYALAKLLPEHEVKAQVHPWNSLADAIGKTLQIALESEPHHQLSSNYKAELEYEMQGEQVPTASSTSTSCAASALSPFAAPLDPIKLV